LFKTKRAQQVSSDLQDFNEVPQYTHGVDNSDFNNHRREMEIQIEILDKVTANYKVIINKRQKT